MINRYALLDAQWECIKDLLPGQTGQPGATAKDNRLFVDAVLYRYRAGIPWRDLPARFSVTYGHLGSVSDSFPLTMTPRDP